MATTRRRSFRASDSEAPNPEGHVLQKGVLGPNRIKSSPKETQSPDDVGTRTLTVRQAARRNTVHSSTSRVHREPIKQREFWAWVGTS